MLLTNAKLGNRHSAGSVFEFELNRSALQLSGWVRGHPRARATTLGADNCAPGTAATTHFVVMLWGVDSAVSFVPFSPQG
jgi:hypothetical protein